jgi:hypothetical protein
MPTRTSRSHRPSANMAYQVTDLTHWHVPEGSSIVPATVRCSESNLSLNPTTLYRELLGGEGKVIRMMQLSSDSWMLLGFRYSDGASGAYNRKGPTLLDADCTSSPPSDAASDSTERRQGRRVREWRGRCYALPPANACSVVGVRRTAVTHVQRQHGYGVGGYI